MLIISFIGATPLVNFGIQKLKEHTFMKKLINILEPIVLIILLIWVSAYLVDNSYNPFLYFRF